MSNERADIYSWAMIAYELHTRQTFLTGMHKKFDGGSYEYPAGPSNRSLFSSTSANLSV